MNTQRMAEDLVEMGYASSSYSMNTPWLRFKNDPYREHEHVDPFANTLEAKHQLAALLQLHRVGTFSDRVGNYPDVEHFISFKPETLVKFYHQDREQSQIELIKLIYTKEEITDETRNN